MSASVVGLALWNAEVDVHSTVNTHAQTTLNTGGFIILINNVVIVLSISSVVLAYFFRKTHKNYISALSAVVLLLILSLCLLSSKGTTDVVAEIYDVAEPVYSWRDKKNRFTFHFQPALEGETQGEIQFYAFRTQRPSTEPVIRYWDAVARKDTFHFAPAWEGEVETGTIFYAFREAQEGASPVWDFINTRAWGGGERTLHFPPSWRGEKRVGIKFHAYRSPPCQALPGKGAQFPVVVPLAAFLLGIATATMFAALYKWSTGEGAADEDISLDTMSWPSNIAWKSSNEVATSGAVATVADDHHLSLIDNDQLA